MMESWLRDGLTKEGGPGTVIEKVTFTPDRTQIAIVLTPAANLTLPVNTDDGHGNVSTITLF